MSDRLSESDDELAREAGITVQPRPIHQDGVPSSHDLVIEDMKARKEFGLKKYGTTLQAGNGRDALQDAYEEALDLVVYMRTILEERELLEQARRLAERTLADVRAAERRDRDAAERARDK